MPYIDRNRSLDPRALEEALKVVADEIKRQVIGAAVPLGEVSLLIELRVDFGRLPTAVRYMRAHLDR